MTDTTFDGEEGVYVPKSYQFERDMDRESNDKRFDTLLFDEDANDHFVTIDIDLLMQDKAQLNEMIRTFLSSQKERIDILEDYSNGDNYTILQGQRRIQDNKSDYRIRHNWGGYFSNFITGFVIGNDITVTAPDKKMQSKIDDYSELNELKTLNYELGYDTSRYGRAFEMHYRDDAGNDRVVVVDADELFVIRSASITKEIVGAVHVPIYNGKLHITIYTDSHVYKYTETDVGNPVLTGEKRTKNHYGIVPVVEWWNDRFRRGDWESEIPLMDAYDASQSDTSNYMSDLNDALLFINIDSLDEIGGMKNAEKMMDMNLFIAESGYTPDGKATTASAEYLYKQYDVQGTEAYKKRLVEDMFKLTNVPNLEDDRFFSGNSGIALEYKMIGLHQRRVTKESFYRRALGRRYEILSKVWTDIRPSEITYNFHPNIPQDTWAEIERYLNAGGEISQETLAANTSFIDSWADEKVQIIAEDNSNMSDEELSFTTRNRVGVDDDTTTAV